MPPRSYRIAPFLGQACRALGLSPARVLARAGLAADYLAHETRGLAARDWFGVLSGLLAEAGGDDRSIELGRVMAAGPLHPALIAFSASPDIGTGLRRLATFKPLIAPISLHVAESDGQLLVEIRASEDTPLPPQVAAMELAYFIELFRLCSAADITPLPPQVAAMELAYFIELFRLCSAADITPLRITLPTTATEPLAAFARCLVRPGKTAQLVLTRDAANAPILSADTEVYRAVERELGLRLKALQAADGMADRVAREIRHLLPSGRVSVEAVADRLRVSTRSLQRHLQQEGASFQGLLDKTRADLALIYLRDHKLSTEETSFLLAYRDPNSFYRAFSDWTGMTPAEARASP